MNYVDSGLDCQRLAISGDLTRCPDLEIEVYITPAGAMAARPSRAGEHQHSLIAAASLQFMVGREASDVGRGDVVIPLAPGIIGQTLAIGMGAVTLTDQRALGLVWTSSVDAQSLSASIDGNRRGSVLVFSVDRPLLTKAKVSKSLMGTERSVRLAGACFVNLDAPFMVLGDSGSYVTAPKGVVAQTLKGFTQG